MTVRNLTEDNISVLMALCLGYAKISIKYASDVDLALKALDECKLKLIKSYEVEV